MTYWGGAPKSANDNLTFQFLKEINRTTELFHVKQFPVHFMTLASEKLFLLLTYTKKTVTRTASKGHVPLLIKTVHGTG